mmetsp:Transcript_14503/g.31819  ORF Transcript_14503/g.31819 Transcript_14503/m.31819 type:complete len:1079 (-) Transcript_14503:43-3279(-)
MSRKSKEDKSGWAVPQLHVFSGDYCPFKPPRDGSPIRGPDVLVLLTRTPLERDGRHVMRPLAPAGQSLLLGPARRFRHLVVVDVAPMLVPPEGAPSDGQQHDPTDALRKEDETREPAKGFGKSLLRLVQRLGLEDVTLAAEGELCPVLLKILENAGGPALSADVWLIRPVLSARFVNNVLAPMGNGNGKAGGRRSRVHAVFDDEASRDRRLGMIRHAFPEGEARVLSDGLPRGVGGDGDILMRVFGDASADGGEPGEYDPDSCDEVGRKLFLSEVKVEMDRHSKQYERTSEDVTDALVRVVEDVSGNGEALPSDVDWTKCETHVGALVLRGNRCLLARSLQGLWKGMRIPSVVAAEGESDHDAAARAVVEHTGVDADEVRELPLLSTVNVYGPNGRNIVLRLVPVYAVSPPPDGPLENQDMEDDETSYDWYTLANAERRLDERSVAGLRSISLSLVEAANVGLLPNRWGGVFGQELSVSMGWAGAAADDDALPRRRPLLSVGEAPAEVADPSAEIMEGLTPVEKRLAKSKSLLEALDFDQAVFEATAVLSCVPPLPVIAGAAYVRGKAILARATREMAKIGEASPQYIFDSALSAFELSAKLNPDCEETQGEIDKLSLFLKALSEMKSKSDEDKVAAPDYEVIIVGAGCSGVGIALMLTETFGLNKDQVLMIERGPEVGHSFRQWPKEMRFISPSFNQQGWSDSFDLNSISYGTSPAFSLHSEHPSGVEYAKYLSAIAKTNELRCKFNTEVCAVTKADESQDENADNPPTLFSVTVHAHEEKNVDEEDAKETLTARYVVWAAGEFQYANKEASGLRGAHLCMHNSEVDSWHDVIGDDMVVIGGYESGVDACYNLAKANKKVSLLASTPCWDTKTTDPSTELAPYTASRLREVCSPQFEGNRPKLYAPLRVIEVEESREGYVVTAEWLHTEEKVEAPLRTKKLISADDTGAGPPGTKLFLKTKNQPILATGFEGSVKAAASHLFEFGDASTGCLGNAPILTLEDESTKVPGIFLVGPQVRHDKLSFCFVYKFRQRFGVVANAICQRLGMETSQAVLTCRDNNMFLDKFDSCGDTCGEVC